jgi:hypothetical protein
LQPRFFRFWIHDRESPSELSRNVFTVLEVHGDVTYEEQIASEIVMRVDSQYSMFSGNERLPSTVTTSADL